METADFAPTAESLLKILERLRAPGGCPWDREQTRLTLSRSLAEECAEFLDAVDRDDPADLCDELGDLFMNVVFQAVIAAEKGEFTYEDMVRGIVNKMVRRHAHIFGNAHAENAEEVRILWEKIKAEERGAKKAPASVLDGVGHYLTALNRAETPDPSAPFSGNTENPPASFSDDADPGSGESYPASGSSDTESSDTESFSEISADDPSSDESRGGQPSMPPEVSLPEKDPAAAWGRLANLDRTQGLLSRKITMVDLRQPDKLIVHLEDELSKKGKKRKQIISDSSKTP